MTSRKSFDRPCFCTAARRALRDLANREEDDCREDFASKKVITEHERVIGFGNIEKALVPSSLS